MARVNVNCIRKPPNPVSRTLVPRGGISYRVKNNDSWESLARSVGMDAWALIRYNYPNLPADNRQAALEVNWYLQEYVGCQDVTRDGKNYMFSSSANPGKIYLPQGMTSSIYHPVPGMSQPKENLCWYASLQMVVGYYRQRGLGRGLKDPSEDPETAEMYRKNEGVSDRERIARKLGFSVLYQSLTETGMWEMLKKGPVIYAGQWPGQLSGHWVVITGISGNELTINDPWYGPKTWDYKFFMGQVLLQTAERPLIYVL
jgi:hypothetical protein